MTENEAMSVLHYLLGCKNAVDAGEIDEHNCLNSQEKEALKFVLEEIQQYRAIGTVEQLEWCKDASHWKELFKEKLEQYEAIGTIEEFKALKEKNEPKKARFYAHNYHCSVCENLVGNNEFEWQRFLYCDNCGQKLDWSE